MTNEVGPKWKTRARNYALLVNSVWLALVATYVH